VGAARLAKVVFDKGFLDGTELWWLNQHGITFVVPAKANMAVTADARAQATAGEEITVGRRAHTVHHGQGKTARTERLEPEVVGITGLTTYDQYGTPEHERQAKPVGLSPQSDQCGGGEPVEWKRLWDWGQNRLSDQCLGGEALAGLR
jgi:hypothetical protein